MNTPLGKEVDLGTGQILSDVVPAVRERGTVAPSFSHVSCGHSRPPQLLLSSCLSSPISHISPAPQSCSALK